MAARRIRSTINSPYSQSLKLKTDRKLLLSLNNNYNSVVFTKKHRAFDPRSIQVNVWAKFNGENFDGIHMVANLKKDNDRRIQSASCEFKVYYVDANQNWGENLIFTGNALLNNNLWVLPASQIDLGPLNELDGERSLKIEATLSRLGKTYKKSVYLNHLGIYDSFFRLKQEVEFLSITKKDE